MDDKTVLDTKILIVKVVNRLSSSRERSPYNIVPDINIVG